MPDQSVLATHRDGVAVITINRPETLNALDVPTLLLLEQTVRQALDEQEVRVLLFRGAGERAFVAGGDISDLNSRQGLAHYQEFAEIIHRVFRLIETSDKPTIGAISGWCLGGGTELLLCLDLRVAAEGAKIGLPEIKLGLFPGAGGTQRLMRQVSPARAKELMFIGEPISARTAYDFGLINRVTPNDQVFATAGEMAATLAARSPLVLKLLKRTLRDGAEMPAAAALAHEQAMIGLVLDTSDAHEGCSAFLEKRAPRFKGE